MRKFQLDDQVIKCRESSTSGFSTWKCKRGNILVFKEWCDHAYSPRLGRSLGRVICGRDGLEDCTGHICVVVPNESFTHMLVQWIDPADVTQVFRCPQSVPGRFFSISQDPAIPGWPLTNDSALEMAEKIEKGYGMEPPDNLEIA